MLGYVALLFWQILLFVDNGAAGRTKQVCLKGTGKGGQSYLCPRWQKCCDAGCCNRRRYRQYYWMTATLLAVFLVALCYFYCRWKLQGNHSARTRRVRTSRESRVGPFVHGDPPPFYLGPPPSYAACMPPGSIWLPPAPGMVPANGPIGPRSITSPPPAYQSVISVPVHNQESRNGATNPTPVLPLTADSRQTQYASYLERSNSNPNLIPHDRQLQQYYHRQKEFDDLHETV